MEIIHENRLKRLVLYLALPPTPQQSSLHPIICIQRSGVYVQYVMHVKIVEPLGEKGSKVYTAGFVLPGVDRGYEIMNIYSIYTYLFMALNRVSKRVHTTFTTSISVRMYKEYLTTSIMSPALAALGDWSSGRRMRSGAPITLPLPVYTNKNDNGK